MEWNEIQRRCNHERVWNSVMCMECGAVLESYDSHYCKGYPITRTGTGTLSTFYLGMEA